MCVNEILELGFHMSQQVLGHSGKSPLSRLALFFSGPAPSTEQAWERRVLDPYQAAMVGRPDDSHGKGVHRSLSSGVRLPGLRPSTTAF